MKKSLLALTIAELLTLSAVAQAERGVIMSGDWGRGINADGTHYALTINASDSALGQICSSVGNCGYIVSFNNVTCADGEKNPGLMSSSFGANHVTLVCSKNRYLIEEFDLVDATVRNASGVSIVCSLEGGEFTVSRFSLTGSTRTVDDMRATIQRAPRDLLAPVVQSRPADIRI